MTDDSTGKERPRQGGQAGDRDRRRERLAEALRANLKKRKTQLRSRRTGEADSRPEGLAASTEGNED